MLHRIVTLCAGLAMAFCLGPPAEAQPSCNGIKVPVPLDNIPNPSFEEYRNCPFGISQMSQLLSWQQPGGGTSDFLHLCQGNFNHPELPSTPMPLPDGEGFVGMWKLYDENWLEYVGVILNEPLQAGTTYHLNLQIGFGSNSLHGTLNNVVLSVFGHFDPTFISYPETSCPSINYGFEEIGTVSASGHEEWKKVQITLRPTRRTRVLILGPPCAYQEDQGYFFLDDLELFQYEEIQEAPVIELLGEPCLTELQLRASPYLADFDYQWYRDGESITGSDGSILNLPGGQEGSFTVRLTHPDGSGCTLSEPYTIDLPSFTSVIDTAICAGERLQVGEQILTSSGKHEVLLTTEGGCDSLINVNLVVHPATHHELESIPILCFGDTSTVDIEILDGVQPIAIRWRDGNQEFQRDLTAGEYSLELLDGNDCLTAIDFVLEEPAELGATISVKDIECNGDLDGEITISPFGGTPPFLIQLDDQVAQVGVNATFKNLPPATYRVKVLDNNGCTYYSDASVREPKKIQLTIQIDAKNGEILLGQQFQAFLRTDFPIYLPTISWSFDSEVTSTCDDCSHTTVMARKTGPLTITVTAMDVNGCEHEVTITLKVVSNIKLPNAFSPNGDGKDDYFYVPVQEQVEAISSLKVFNRWGSMVFSTENTEPGVPTLGWDGYFLGRLQNSDVYVYIAELILIDGTKSTHKGDVLLIR